MPPKQRKLITSQPYQTSAYKPVLLAMTILIFGLAALRACLFPVRRASLVNPVQTLRVQ
jgi:ABC-type lipoprotein release transport system permease subunit